MSHSSDKPNKSSVRHTRAIARDRTKSPTIVPPDAEVERLMRDIIQPATWAQVAHFQQLGLRERVLTLPVMVDLGFVNHTLFAELTERSVGFVTRLKSNAVVSAQTVLAQTPVMTDALLTLGTGKTRCSVTLRMVCVLYQGKWHRYLTNVLDPAVLPTEYVVALYWQRWRIEEAYLTVKRLLGLSYFACTHENGVLVQLWATWILHAVLFDLTDAVAEELQQPFALISVEMVYRGLSHFSQAYHKGRAADPIEYLARKARELAIIKTKRPKSLDAVVLLTNQLKA